MNTPGAVQKPIPFARRFFDALLRGPMWLLLYLLVVVGITVCISNGIPPNPVVKATGTMLPGHRITADDIAARSGWVFGWSRFLGPNANSTSYIAGEYIRRNVTQGDIITAANAGIGPPGYLLLHVASDVLGPDQVTVDDVGKQAELCVDETGVRCTSDVLVQQVDCSLTDKRLCSISIWVAATQRDVVLGLVQEAQNISPKHVLHVLTLDKAQN